MILKTSSKMNNLLKNQCRICLEECDSNQSYKKFKVGEVLLIEILQTYMNEIDWMNTVGKPDKICSSCTSKIFLFDNLNKKAIQNQEYLDVAIQEDEQTTESSMECENSDENEEANESSSSSDVMECDSENDSSPNLASSLKVMDYKTFVETEMKSNESNPKPQSSSNQNKPTINKAYSDSSLSDDEDDQKAIKVRILNKN